MRVLNESIARQANREDHCTNRFWEGRFKSHALLDEAEILRGAIPAHMQPIFQRMGLNHEEWLEIVQNFGRRYRLAASAVNRLQASGQRPGRYWLQSIGTSRRLYRTSDAAPARGLASLTQT